MFPPRPRITSQAVRFLSARSTLHKANPVAGIPKKSAAKRKPSKPRSTVFVIRDDEHQRQKVTNELTKSGFDVHSYFTAREFFLDRVPKTSGVVVADYRLRDMNGVELVEQLKAKRIALSVILFAGPADVPKVAKLKTTDFLVHPYDHELLLEAIDRALNGYEYDEDELNEAFRRLTEREIQILNAICTGSSSRELGTALKISTKTVEAHRARIMAKTRAADIGELIRLYRVWNG